MENIIKQILALDKEAEDYRKHMEEILLKNKIELEESIEKIAREAELILNEKKKEILSSKIKEAEVIASVIREKGEIEMKGLEEKFIKTKDEIIEQILNDIIYCK